MGTIFDYLSWRGDLTFAQAPFSEVDALLFSMISYIDYEGIVSGKQGGKTVALQEAASTYFAQRPNREKISLGVLIPKEIVDLLDAARKVERFRSVLLGGYVNYVSAEEETQFCAVTFFLGSGQIVVTFRGTDDSIVGWRENCNLSFLESTPAQRAATAYLERVHEVFPNSPIIVTGHSKGGNLAAYAVLHCNDQTASAITVAYNFDGPGTLLEDWYAEGSFPKSRKAILHTFIPEHSIVGLLLKHDPDFIAIKSNLKGIVQHNGLSWLVMGASFIRTQGPAKDSQRNQQRLNNWVNGMTVERRREAVNAIFSLFSASGASTLTELVAHKGAWIQKCRELDPSIYSTLEEVFLDLLKPQKKKEAKNFLEKVSKK